MAVIGCFRQRRENLTGRAMRRKIRSPHLARSAAAQRRRPDAAVPGVPEFEPPPDAKPAEPAAAAAEPDPTEEAIRRMIEAAYT
jgi:hypothetical protein